MNSEPTIITYTNLLHQYRDVDSPEVQAFVQQHIDDSIFMERVEVLNQIFKLKISLTEE